MLNFLRGPVALACLATLLLPSPADAQLPPGNVPFPPNGAIQDLEFVVGEGDCREVVTLEDVKRRGVVLLPMGPPARPVTDADGSSTLTETIFTAKGNITKTTEVEVDAHGNPISKVVTILCPPKTVVLTDSDNDGSWDRKVVVEGLPGSGTKTTTHVDLNDDGDWDLVIVQLETTTDGVTTQEVWFDVGADGQADTHALFEVVENDPPAPPSFIPLEMDLDGDGAWDENLAITPWDIGIGTIPGGTGVSIVNDTTTAVLIILFPAPQMFWVQQTVTQPEPSVTVTETKVDRGNDGSIEETTVEVVIEFDGGVQTQTCEDLDGDGVPDEITATVTMDSCELVLFDSDADGDWDAVEGDATDSECTDAFDPDALASYCG